MDRMFPPLARWPWTRATPTLCGPAPESRLCAATSRWGAGSTSRRMRARLGPKWDWRRLAALPILLLILITPTLCWPALWAMPMVHSRSAASFAPLTAAKPGNAPFSWMRTPVAAIWRWTRTIHTFSSPECGRSKSIPGAATVAVRAAGYSNPMTGAQPGSVWKSMGCRMRRWAASPYASRPRTHTASTRSLKPAMAR